MSRTRGGRVVLPNATVYDGALSYRALGLLAAMLARPPEASFDMRQFSGSAKDRAGREGRDALRAAVQELEDQGYVWRFKVRAGGGKGMVTETVRSPVPISREAAEELLERRNRSRKQGPDYQAPVFQAPVLQAPLPTEGHSPSSLRSGEKSSACESGPPAALDPARVAEYASEARKALRGDHKALGEGSSRQGAPA